MAPAAAAVAICADGALSLSTNESRESEDGAILRAEDRLATGARMCLIICGQMFVNIHEFLDNLSLSPIRIRVVLRRLVG